MYWRSSTTLPGVPLVWKPMCENSTFGHESSKYPKYSKCSKHKCCCHTHLYASNGVGETAFTHDPNYKPPHAVVDKWYRTEAGSKNSLAGRVEESRWQSCHSMQSGREPRKPTRSRLPWDQKKAGPGPASYHMRDPWEVRVSFVFLYG